MKKPRSHKASRALILAGKRIDHPENVKSRKHRELGAAFNRMSSSNDSEALSAFARARDITQEIGSSFYAIWRGSREQSELHEINKKLAQQLKDVLQENAKYRAMNLSYRLKGELIQSSRVLFRAFLMLLPVAIVGILFYMGFLGAGGAALLLLPIGFYSASRGVIIDSPGSIVFGIIVLLIGIIATSIVSDRDAPVVRRQEAALLENMKPDHELGPETITIDYPLSHSTRVATVLGIRDTLKFALEDGKPIEIYCAKYYDRAVIVRESKAKATPPPEQPDIFHSIPVATFGACDLYAKLTALHD